MKSSLLIIRLAFASIFSNKTRAILTMLGIIIGVGSVIAVMSIGAGAESLITGQIKKLGTNTLTVFPGASDDSGPPASVFGITITTLIRDDADQIEKLPDVIAVTSYARGNGEVVYGNRSVVADFSGVTAKYQEAENHFISEGRFFNEAEDRSVARVAILGADLKESLFPISSPLNKKVKINDQSFKVIGVMEKKGSSLMNSTDSQIIVPLTTAQRLLLGTRHLSMIRIKVETEENVQVAKERITKLLRSQHDIKKEGDDDFSVRTVSQALNTFNTITAAIGFFLAAIAALSLIVGGIGITNIMLMTVKERTREIGLRKAIGASPKNISNQFLLETTVLTTIGGILGIIAGILLSFATSIIINYLEYDWSFSIPLLSIFVSFFIAAFVGLAFGVYPARKASKLNPIESLRYE